MTLTERIEKALSEIEHDCHHWEGREFMQTREMNRDEAREVLRNLVRDVLQEQRDTIFTQVQEFISGSGKGAGQ